MCLRESVSGKPGRKKSLSNCVQQTFCATDGMSVPPTNSHVEALTLRVMVFGGGASGQWLGFGEVMRVELVSLKEEEERPGLPFCLCAMWGHNEKLAVYTPGRGPSPQTQPCWCTNLRLADSRVVRNKCCLSHLVYTLLQKPELTKTSSVSGC